MTFPSPNVDSEARRSRAIAALDLIDTPAEREFDALAALAARLLDCPIGLVSLIDRDRQWVKAVTGMALRETARSESVCNHTIEQDGPLVIDDLTADARVSHSRYVTAEDGVRAYAGIPISSRDPESGERVAIGAVCAIDTMRRPFTPGQREMLVLLQNIADALLEGRALRTGAQATAETLRRQDRTFRQAERLVEIGSWRLTLGDNNIEWSDGSRRIHEVDASFSPTLDNALDSYPPHARSIVTDAIAHTIGTGEPFEFETDLITARGRLRRVRSVGEMELRDGQPHALIGVFQDVTERHAIEQRLRQSATIDTLTGIANRAAFNARLEAAVAEARAKQRPLTLAMIDLDRFKAINDTHGHLAGDDMLRAFGRRIDRAARGGFAARLGGDEFGLILDGEASGRAEQIIAQLLLDLRRPVHATDQTLQTSGTIGYVRFTPEIETIRELLHRADSALYQAKRNERGTAQIWGRMRTGERRGEAGERRADAA